MGRSLLGFLMVLLGLASGLRAEVRLSRDPRTGEVLAQVTPPSRLEDVARAAYGDPNQWRAIYAANQAQLARPAAGGTVVLRIPPPGAPVPPPQARAPSPGGPQGGGFLEVLVRILVALLQGIGSAGAGSSRVMPPASQPPPLNPGVGTSWIGSGVLGSSPDPLGQGPGKAPGYPNPAPSPGPGAPAPGPGSPAPAAPGGARFKVWATSEEPQGTATGVYMSASTVAAALPDRSAFNRRLRVHYQGRSVEMPVIDLGPWNLKDPYWETGSKPRAQAAFETGGRDDKGRRVGNPAGIDLSWAAWRQLGVGSPSDHSDWVEWEWID